MSLRALLATLIFCAELPALAATSTTTHGSVEKDWTLDNAIYHYNSYKENQPAETDISFSGSKKISDNKTLSLLQVLKKKYEINKGEDEWDFADTYLRYNFSPGHTIFGFKPTYRAELTAPTSSFSIKHGVVSKPEVHATLNRKFFSDSLALSLRPHARYYINRYQTTETGAAENGGRPLKQAHLGLYFLVQWEFVKNYQLTSYQGWARAYYEKNNLKNENRLSDEENPPDHEYFFDLSVAHDINEHLSLALGHSLASRAEKSGGIEVVAYDGEVSQWYILSSLSF